MKVSSRGEYGVRAMVALAKHYGQGPMSIAAMRKDESWALIRHLHDL